MVNEVFCWGVFDNQFSFLLVNMRLADDSTPIFLAALHGHCNTVYKLFTLGAEVHLVDQSGLTLLHYAIRSGR